MMELGVVPAPLSVHLTTGADFSTVLTLDQPWPSGTVLTLGFADGSVWTATISGADATFAVDKASADLVPDQTQVTLVYTSGTTDQVWAAGKVVRHG